MDGFSSGSGITGLAIARRAVEGHGGRISARNHPDGGLKVVIELPAAPALANLARTPPGTAPPTLWDDV